MIRRRRAGHVLVAVFAGGALALAAACSSDRAPSGSPAAPRASSTSSPAPEASQATASTPPSRSAPTTTSSPSSRALSGRVVVVDPGHNGANAAHPEEISRLVDAGGFQKACNTTGTAEGDLTESRFNWETAQRVRAALEAAGATVVLTRTSDDGWGPCVDQRGLAADAAGADLLISIHADGAAASASGFHVIRPAIGPTVTPERREASARLAAQVRDALVAEGFSPAGYVGGGEGIVERADIATINRADVPAVMLESGNLHNPDDLATLRSPDGQQRIADALTAAVTSALG